MVSRRAIEFEISIVKIVLFPKPQRLMLAFVTFVVFIIVILETRLSFINEIQKVPQQSTITNS